MGIEVERVTAERWDDLVELFELFELFERPGARAEMRRVL